MRPDVHLARPKRPTEEFRVSWDFVNDVADGDSYSAFEVKAFDVLDGSDVSVSLLQGAGRVGVTGAVIGVQIQAGTDGHDYDVRFQLTTTQGDVFQRVVRVAVRA